MGYTGLGSVRLHEARHGAIRPGNPRVPLAFPVRVPALKRGVRGVEHRRVHDLRRTRPDLDFAKRFVPHSFVDGLVFGEAVAAARLVIAGSAHVTGGRGGKCTPCMSADDERMACDSYTGERHGIGDGV